MLVFKFTSHRRGCHSRSSSNASHSGARGTKKHINIATPGIWFDIPHFIIILWLLLCFLCLVLPTAPPLVNWSTSATAPLLVSTIERSLQCPYMCRRRMRKIMKSWALYRIDDYLGLKSLLRLLLMPLGLFNALITYLNASLLAPVSNL